VFPRDVEVVETLADYLRNVGFEPHFLYAGPEAFLDQLLVPPDRYRWDLALLGFTPATGDGGDELSQLFASNPDTQHPPRAWNIAWYADPAVDGWLREAAGTAGPARRTAAYAKVERRVWEDAPYLWLYTEDTTVATRGVRDVVVLPTVFTILRSARPQF
jgi:ABC-type transport system substrate-binding protein